MLQRAVGPHLADGTQGPGRLHPDPPVGVIQRPDEPVHRTRIPQASQTLCSPEPAHRVGILQRLQEAGEGRRQGLPLGGHAEPVGALRDEGLAGMGDGLYRAPAAALSPPMQGETPDRSIPPPAAGLQGGRREGACPLPVPPPWRYSFQSFVLRESREKWGCEAKSNSFRRDARSSPVSGNHRGLPTRRGHSPRERLARRHIIWLREKRGDCS